MILSPGASAVSPQSQYCWELFSWNLTGSMRNPHKGNKHFNCHTTCDNMFCSAWIVCRSCVSKSLQSYRWNKPVKREAKEERKNGKTYTFDDSHRHSTRDEARNSTESSPKEPLFSFATSCADSMRFAVCLGQILYRLLGVFYSFTPMSLSTLTQNSSGFTWKPKCTSGLQTHGSPNIGNGAYSFRQPLGANSGRAGWRSKLTSHAPLVRESGPNLE